MDEKKEFSFREACIAIRDKEKSVNEKATILNNTFKTLATQYARAGIDAHKANIQIGQFAERAIQDLLISGENGSALEKAKTFYAAVKMMYNYQKLYNGKFYSLRISYGEVKRISLTMNI